MTFLGVPVQQVLDYVMSFAIGQYSFELFPGFIGPNILLLERIIMN